MGMCHRTVIRRAYKRRAGLTLTLGNSAPPQLPCGGVLFPTEQYLIEINASTFLPHVFCLIAATRPRLVGTKRWRQPLTIGNGPKSASSGRAKPLTRACASNTPASALFGLTALRGLSFGPAQSRRQTQK